MRSLVCWPKPSTQIVRAFRFPTVMLRPLGFDQFWNVELLLGAFALRFAVIRTELPLFDATFCPLVSAVAVCVVPAPVEQFVEPVKPLNVKSKCLFKADLTLTLPSVK